MIIDISMKYLCVLAFFLFIIFFNVSVSYAGLWCKQQKLCALDTLEGVNFETEIEAVSNDFKQEKFNSAAEKLQKLSCLSYLKRVALLESFLPTSIEGYVLYTNQSGDQSYTDFGSEIHGYSYDKFGSSRGAVKSFQGDEKGDIVSILIADNDNAKCKCSNTCSKRGEEGDPKEKEKFFIMGKPHAAKEYKGYAYAFFNGRKNVPEEISDEMLGPYKNKLVIQSKGTIYVEISGRALTEEAGLKFADTMNIDELMKTGSE